MASPLSSVVTVEPLKLKTPVNAGFGILTVRFWPLIPPKFLSSATAVTRTRLPAAIIILLESAVTEIESIVLSGVITFLAESCSGEITVPLGTAALTVKPLVSI